LSGTTSGSSVSSLRHHAATWTTTLRRSSTPRKLWLCAGSLLLLAVCFAVAAGVTAGGRSSATSAAAGKAEPLVVDAQSIDTYLSDADTTAAGSILQSQLPSAALVERFRSDVAAASTALAATSQEIGQDPQSTAALRTIEVALPAYTQAVESATFNQRQQFYPLAGAYMAEANNLMHAKILPAASQVYAKERSQLVTDQSNAASPWAVVVVALLFIMLLAGLVLFQRWLSGRFRRTLNVALVVGSALIFVAGGWFLVAAVVQGADVNTAASTGTDPVTTFTQARIDALAMQADDELTLLSRDAVASYQQDYRTTAQELTELLAKAQHQLPAADQPKVEAAQRALEAYESAHGLVRHDDQADNDLHGAIELATAQGPQSLPTTSQALDGILVGDIASSQASFDSSTSSAGGDLTGLVGGVALLSVVVAVLIALGVWPRLREYR
jgi:hypothetical protein